jgi:hypothetical protein
MDYYYIFAWIFWIMFIVIASGVVSIIRSRWVEEEDRLKVSKSNVRPRPSFKVATLAVITLMSVFILYKG